MSELISVVIPTYDRPSQLDECLKGLSLLHYPRDRFEVVVVDDGGSAPLDPIVDRFRGTMSVTLQRQVNSGPAAARNRGAALARGSFLAFIDDDCVPEPRWLEALVRQSVAAPGHLVGGQTINQLADNPYSTASQHLVSYLYGYERSGDGPQVWTSFFASNNLGVPAEEFHRIGGFDPTFPLAAGEDRDFCARWTEAGLDSIYAEDARIMHRHHLGLTSFWRQHVKYGRGAFHFRRARLERGADPAGPEPVRVYRELILYPFNHEPRARALALSSLLGLSQVANVLGYVGERRRHR